MGPPGGAIRGLITGALLAGAALHGSANAAAQVLQGDPQEGRRLFVERGCGRCHSVWGNGGTLGPDLALVGAGRSTTQLAGLFWNHTPRMIETVRARGAVWPTFTEVELTDIISYIYYVKLFDEVGDPRLGEQWFAAKRCVECHALGGTGGRRGPPLDGYARFVAPINLAQGMWNHGPGMRALQTATGVPVPTFLGREMADIQAYVRVASSLSDRNAVLLEAPDPETGERLFTSKGCRGCHGQAGRGTEVAPDLRMVTHRRRVSEIAGILWNHSAGMFAVMQARGVPLPRFQGTELANVISYLYYLPFGQIGGDVRRGEARFHDKGCVRCHDLDDPARMGPDLTRSEAVSTPLGMATAMWNHAPGMFAAARLRGVDWPRFEGDEMSDLLAYLRTLARRAAP